MQISSLVIPCQNCIIFLTLLKMLFLYLLIIIRSPLMHFSQICPTSPIFVIFGYGYILQHFGGQIFNLWFWINLSNFFHLFCIEIVELGTNFDNLAKNGPKPRKLAQNVQTIRPFANDLLEVQASCNWSSGGTGLLQLIFRRIRPLTNDHPEDPAFSKWSSGGSGLLQISSVHPLNLVTSARIQYQSRRPFQNNLRLLNQELGR